MLFVDAKTTGSLITLVKLQMMVVGSLSEAAVAAASVTAMLQFSSLPCILFSAYSHSIPAPAKASSPKTLLSACSLDTAVPRASGSSFLPNIGFSSRG